MVLAQIATTMDMRWRQDPAANRTRRRTCLMASQPPEPRTADSCRLLMSTGSIRLSSIGYLLSLRLSLKFIPSCRTIRRNLRQAGIRRDMTIHPKRESDPRKSRAGINAVWRKIRVSNHRTRHGHDEPDPCSNLRLVEAGLGWAAIKKAPGTSRSFFLIPLNSETTSSGSAFVIAADRRVPHRRGRRDSQGFG